MSSSILLSWAVLISVLFVLLYLLLLPPHRQWLFLDGQFVMPPGPPGQPIVGNLLEWLKACNGNTMAPWVYTSSLLDRFSPRLESMPSPLASLATLQSVLAVN